MNYRDHKDTILLEEDLHFQSKFLTDQKEEGKIVHGPCFDKSMKEKLVVNYKEKQLADIDFTTLPNYSIIKELDLRTNTLTFIGDSVSKLDCLRILKLGYNKI